jgi:hypothetical protein
LCCKELLKPGIDCARLSHEALFVALPNKVDTMLPRAADRTLPRGNLAHVEPDKSGSLSRGKWISVCCVLSVETVLWRSGVFFVDQQSHAAAALRCWTQTRLLSHKQTNEFAAHEQLRAQSIPDFVSVYNIGILLTHSFLHCFKHSESNCNAVQLHTERF